MPDDWESKWAAEKADYDRFEREFADLPAFVRSGLVRGLARAHGEQLWERPRPSIAEVLRLTPAEVASMRDLGKRAAALVSAWQATHGPAWPDWVAEE